LRPSSRPGAAAYVETFVLIALAVGGSALVLDVASRYASGSGGTAVSVGEGVIVQGRYMALERIVVYNVGDSPITSFTVSTEGASPTASYCYSLFDPQNSKPIAATCPDMSEDPRDVYISSAIQPGRGLLVDLTIEGSSFQAGAGQVVAVTTSGGAQAVVGVEVAPA
jgi:hypothetical protein